MPQIEAYLEMDSTDEKIFRKQQMIREAEAREQAKRVQKELARKRAEQVVPDKMKSMSSADFQPAQPIQEPGAARQQFSTPVDPFKDDRQFESLGGGATHASSNDRPKKAMVLGKAGAKKIPNEMFE